MKTSKVSEVAKRWLSNAEAAKYLGVSLDTLRKFREEAKLRYYQMGTNEKGRKMIWYEVADLDKFVRKFRAI